MAVQEVDILNQALAYLGKPPVQDLNSDEPFVTWFRLNYETVRDSVVIENEYSFAIRRFIVDSEYDAWVEPDFEFDYGYILEGPGWVFLRTDHDDDGAFSYATSVELPDNVDLQAAGTLGGTSRTAAINLSTINLQGSVRLGGARGDASGIQTIYPNDIEASREFPLPGTWMQLEIYHVPLEGSTTIPGMSYTAELGVVELMTEDIEASFTTQGASYAASLTVVAASTENIEGSRTSPGTSYAAQLTIVKSVELQGSRTSEGASYAASLTIVPPGDEDIEVSITVAGETYAANVSVMLPENEDVEGSFTAAGMSYEVRRFRVVPAENEDVEGNFTSSGMSYAASLTIVPPGEEDIEVSITVAGETYAASLSVVLPENEDVEGSFTSSGMSYAADLAVMAPPEPVIGATDIEAAREMNRVVNPIVVNVEVVAPTAPAMRDPMRDLETDWRINRYVNPIVAAVEVVPATDIDIEGARNTPNVTYRARRVQPQNPSAKGRVRLNARLRVNGTTYAAEVETQAAFDSTDDREIHGTARADNWNESNQVRFENRDREIHGTARADNWNESNQVRFENRDREIHGTARADSWSESSQVRFFDRDN